MNKHRESFIAEQPPLHRRGFFARLAALGATAMIAASVKGARTDGREPMLNELKHEHFSGLVDQLFTIKHDGGLLPVTLIEVKNLSTQPRAGLREPFSLIFRSNEHGHLPQSIYEVRHATLGAQEIFLVPIGADEQGMRYQAVFA